MRGGSGWGMLMRGGVKGILVTICIKGWFVINSGGKCFGEWWFGYVCVCSGA